MLASQNGFLNLDAFRAYVPGETGERIPESGHFITIFQAERVAQAMLDMNGQHVHA